MSVVLLAGNRLFTEFKRALTEQYVLQQLLVSGLEPIFYWGLERAVAEVDFIVQHSSQTYTIEVKSRRNLRLKFAVAL